MVDPTTRPGDLVGHDSSGQLRIDRVIPLPWVLGMLGAVCVQAVTLWFQVQAATETVRKIETRLDAIIVWQTSSQVADAELRADMRELRRRIEKLEGAR